MTVQVTLASCKERSCSAKIILRRGFAAISSPVTYLIFTGFI